MIELCSTCGAVLGSEGASCGSCDGGQGHAPAAPVLELDATRAPMRSAAPPPSSAAPAPSLRPAAFPAGGPSPDEIAADLGRLSGRFRPSTTRPPPPPEVSSARRYAVLGGVAAAVVLGIFAVYQGFLVARNTLKAAVVDDASAVSHAAPNDLLIGHVPADYALATGLEGTLVIVRKDKSFVGTVILSAVGEASMVTDPPKTLATTLFGKHAGGARPSSLTERNATCWGDKPGVELVGEAEQGGTKLDVYACTFQLHANTYFLGYVIAADAPSMEAARLKRMIARTQLPPPGACVRSNGVLHCAPNEDHRPQL
ncbi:MAG: hypothetical protein JST00_29430 [Deltaproteobacteria bacterium]|nr:hypothetical protein [Deltaproteobacteria bacterium]